MTVTLLQAVAPIPRDIQLPLPLNPPELQVILVGLFLLHIIFVNLMVGGSVLTVLFEILGRTTTRFDDLARKIGETITVNKSLAVVLGVGPLLAINLLYTTHFYTANVLTGYAWISIIPLVALAFLLSYLHKFTWHIWSDRLKRTHIFVGAMSTLLFLCIPLIFLTNINLMLFPAQWPQVTGFFSSLRVGNVFPRYFHFLAASLAVTALFLAGWFGRKKFPIQTTLPGFTRQGLRRLFYRVALYVTAVQVVFGPLLLLTLPSQGVTTGLLWIVVGGVSTAIVVVALLWRRKYRPMMRTSDDSMLRYGYSLRCWWYSWPPVGTSTVRPAWKRTVNR